MSRSDGPYIVGVQAWKCVFSLTPFRLGVSTISAREYVVVRVLADNGHEGVAFGLTRGAPIDVVVAELVGPRFLGRAIGEPARAQREVAASLLPHYVEGLTARAMSLIDIAIWDALGKTRGSPLWSLFGERRREAPVMLVEGYPIEGETDTQFVDRLGGRAAEGYEYLKLAYTADDPEGFTKRLFLLSDELPSAARLAVDISWSWMLDQSTRNLVAAWADLPLAWLEDPVPADDLNALWQLKSWSGIPVGVGDEVARQATLKSVAAAGLADVIRVDATCAGGISGAMDIIASAPSGTMVSTHVYPDIHRHIALGLTESGPVEMFPVDNPWDTHYRFAAPIAAREVDGRRRVLAADAGAPGLGIEIDWHAIREAAVRESVCGEI